MDQDLSKLGIFKRLVATVVALAVLFGLVAILLVLIEVSS